MWAKQASKIVDLRLKDGCNVDHYDPLVESMTYPSLEEIIWDMVLVGHSVMYVIFQRE